MKKHSQYLNNSDAIDLRTEAQKWLKAFKVYRDVQRKLDGLQNDCRNAQDRLDNAKREQWRCQLEMHQAALHMSKMLEEKVPRWFEYDAEGNTRFFELD